MLINPQKELFKWGPIKFKLIYASCFMQVALDNIQKSCEWHWPPALVMYKNGRGLWINEQQDLRSVGLKYFQKYISNKDSFNEHWLKYQIWIRNYDKLSKKIDNLKLTNISSENLYSLLEKFYELNLNFWGIVHIPEIANWGGEYLLKQELDKIDQKKSDQYLEVLSAPIKYSFFQKEELDLLHIGKINNKQELKKALEKHAEKYHWLLNSYGGNRVLTPAYFKTKLNDLIKEKGLTKKINSIKESVSRNIKRKDDLIKQLGLNSSIVKISEQLSEAIWWQDHRKAYIWRMNYYWDLFIEAISERTDYEFQELQWCWGDELLILLKDSNKLDKKSLLQRKKYYLLLGKEGNLEKITDQAVIKQHLKTYWPQNKVDKKYLKGVVVSQGKANKISGTVKIIRDPFKDNEKMQLGDILVASMTSPEYIVAMRKAGAIITDEGGMTSHAAIVSRELGIPCIVGTKVATRALEDWDKVEIDITKGIIRKI